MTEGLESYKMSDAEAARFMNFISENCGISLSKDKKNMLSARLYRRICALGLESFSAYYDYLVYGEDNQDEILTLIDIVTTHKTEFFREAKHLDYLRSAAVPELLGPQAGRGNNTLNIWSAGCSTGEEPYSIAMVMAEYFGGPENAYFHILASDISMRVLKIAKQAVYDKSEMSAVPPALAGKYIMCGKDNACNLCRVIPELRSRVSFEQINLIEDDFLSHKKMDIIFCRNVIIYFNNAAIATLIKKFYKALNPGGYLFIGLAESIYNNTNNLVSVAPSIYRKPER